MKTILRLLPMLAVAGLLVSCGDSGSSKQSQMPDPATQPEAQAAIFQRMCDRVKVLIANKNYQQAQEALSQFKNYKLTPEQQRVVDKLQVQIPKAN
jgi:outer membrane PBP1 activator LpoA protein